MNLQLPLSPKPSLVCTRDCLSRARTSSKSTSTFPKALLTVVLGGFRVLGGFWV